jgi:UDP-N-acetyl-D-mannosaminuronate dehydrogenase
MGIDTNDVLEAAGSKWNFLQYKPGLVGGHCIGVDPYYLAHKSTQLGYHPEVILSGRKVNDNMGIFVANKVVKLMINNGIQVSILPNSNVYTKTGKDITEIVKRIPNCINTEHLTCLYVMNKLSFLN